MLLVFCALRRAAAGFLGIAYVTGELLGVYSDPGSVTIVMSDDLHQSYPFGGTEDETLPLESLGFSMHIGQQVRVYYDKEGKALLCFPESELTRMTLLAETGKNPTSEEIEAYDAKNAPSK